MFSGLIENIGKIKSKKSNDGLIQLEIETTLDLSDTNVGDSFAVDGCCLTVTSKLGNRVWLDVGPETQSLTTIPQLNAGDSVNLERALRMGARLGGHLVQGHIDGVGAVTKVEQKGKAREYVIEIPKELAKYTVKKGSIAVNGVSLTINDCDQNQFSVLVIPHTLENTTFKDIGVGRGVNLEVDIVGKYVEKLTFISSEEYRSESNITKEFLKKHGF
ncbi:riboflavin synthase [bacterium]|nr:riboflavin synthase [bacterium]